MTYNSWDIVVVPFPFVDSVQSKPRPALVISSGNFNNAHQHAVMAMITTGGETSWKSDITITRLEVSGLSVPSLVRMKFFTLDYRLIRKKIGYLDKVDRARVKLMLKENVLGW